MHLRPTQLLLGALLASWAAIAPAPARAEVAAPTSQAAAMQAEFLAYVPPPIAPTAACFVDTGLHVNLDTNGPVLHAEALDPTQSAEDTSDDLHGTRAVMTAFAPLNGWGTVGIWPGGSAVTINALPTGHSDFPFSFYRLGIERCKNLAAIYPIKVIVLALGASNAPDATQMSALADAVDRAHTADLNVVAAAGNAGGPVEWPAAYDPVMAVGAADSTGILCTFSARGPPLDVLAPGCPVQEAFGDTGAPALAQGTSSAAVLVGASLTALRAYAPGLEFSQAEQILFDTSHDGHIDVHAAFQAAGLADVVASGEQAAAQAAAQSTDAGVVAPATPSYPQPPAVHRQLWSTPKASYRIHAGRLVLKLLARPRDAKALVVVVQPDPRGTVRILRRRTTRDAVIRLKVPREGRLRLIVRYLADSSHQQSQALRRWIR